MRRRLGPDGVARGNRFARLLTERPPEQSAHAHGGGSWGLVTSTNSKSQRLLHRGSSQFAWILPRFTLTYAFHSVVTTMRQKSIDMILTDLVPSPAARKFSNSIVSKLHGDDGDRFE
jgi:hypothetical protein